MHHVVFILQSRNLALKSKNLFSKYNYYFFKKIHQFEIVTSPG